MPLGSDTKPAKLDQIKAEPVSAKTTNRTKIAPGTVPIGKIAATPPGGKGNNIFQNIVEVLKPDAFVFGETHASWLGGRAGNFGLISTKNGAITYFGSKPFSPIPDKSNPLSSPILKRFAMGGAIPSVSLVGSNNGKGDEAGLGLSWKVPTPAGDLLVFANFRQDSGTVGNLIDNLKGKGQKDGTVSINIGGCYSASDGAIISLGAVAGGPVGARIGGAISEVAPDAWLGGAWRGTATFENGKIKSINLSGVEIPFDQVAGVIGASVKAQRQSPTLIPNVGSSNLARINDNIQLAYGQSPWAVGDSAKVRTKTGELEIKNGTVDVLNHGSNATALTEPVYELGVKYGVLSPGQKIATNQQAGQVIDEVLNRASAADKRNTASGKTSNLYSAAMNRFMNPYFINFGSGQLKMNNELFQGSVYVQTITNMSRKSQGLKPLLEGTGAAKPKDTAFVKAAFQGDMRYKADNPVRVQPQKPFGF